MTYVGHFRQRYLRATRGGDKHVVYRFDIVTLLALVTNPNGVTLPPFNTTGNFNAPNSPSERILHGFHAKPTTRKQVSKQVTFQIRLTNYPFRINRSSINATRGAQYLFDINRGLFQRS